MAKYHISSKTGEPKECHAKKGNCPLKKKDPDAPHFDSMEEAEAYAEKTNEEKYGLVADSFKKAKLKTKPRSESKEPMTVREIVLQNKGKFDATTFRYVDNYWDAKEDGTLTCNVEGVTGDPVCVTEPVIVKYDSLDRDDDLEFFAEESGGYRKSTSLATTDGYWLVRAYDPVVKVEGITGTPISVAGLRPNDEGYSSTVITTDGCWVVASDGSSVKAEGVTGTPVAVNGLLPQHGFGSGVATSDGYWLVNKDGSSIKAKGVTGTPISSIGRRPRKSGGSAVATTDGYWVVNDDGSTIKAEGVTGTPIAATGETPGTDDGSAVVTDEGYWLVNKDGSTIKARGVTGTPIAITGDRPKASGHGSAIATTDGLWEVREDGYARKLDDVPGTPIYMIGKMPRTSGFKLLTTEGAWEFGPGIAWPKRIVGDRF